jgi:hypothetical protein
MDREQPHDGMGFLDGSPQDSFAAPGKRAPTSRIAARESAGTPPPELLPGAAPLVHDDPFALHLEQPSAASATTSAPVQLKTDPSAAHTPPPPPAETQTKHEKLEEGRWKFAFFFTGGRYGKHAKKYLSTYYPNHEQHDAKSLEDMFKILGKRVPKLEKQREKQDHLLDDMGDAPFVEEIVIVSHGTSAGSLMVPMVTGEDRIFTPWDATALQDEVESGAQQRFESRRRKALRGITADTRIVVRGCEIGDSEQAMHALQAMFGGKPTVFAPHHFQGFQTEKIGGARLKTWKDAFDFLLAGGYIPAELAEESPEDQKKYIKKFFGDGVPSEFFIVSREDHDALDALYENDKKNHTHTSMGPEGEAYKKRVTDNTPSRESEDWAVLDAKPWNDPSYASLTAAELVAEAKKVWATYKPQDGATIVRLYEEWKRATQAEIFTEKKEIDKTKLNTREPLPQLPYEFSASQIEIAEADAKAFPEGQRHDDDEWRALGLGHEMPDAATDIAAHDFSQSERHAEQVAGPEKKKKLTPTQRTRRANRKLVGDLLAGIDAAGRSGLSAVEQWDVDAASHHADVAARRIEHLLSITSLPGKGVEASLRQFADEASIAMGRVTTLATKIAGVAAGPSATLRDVLGSAAQIFEGAGWTWKAIGLEVKKKAGKFTRDRGTRIGTGTLLMIEHRARFLQKKSSPDAVLSTANAITEELRFATAEIANAVDTQDAADADARKKALEDEVRSCGAALREFENLAWAHGVGATESLDAMRGATRALHAAVDIRPENTRLEAMAATTTEEETQFLFAVSHYTQAYSNGRVPDPWTPISRELDAYAGKVRVAAETMWSPERDKKGGLARAVEVWGEARYKVIEIIERARGHAAGDDGLGVAIDLGQEAVDLLDHDIPRARGGELMEKGASEAAIEDPESGYFDGVADALGGAITNLDKLWDKYLKMQIEMADKGGAKEVTSALYKSYKIIKNVWTGKDSLRALVQKAKNEGLDVETVAQLVQKALEVVKDSSKLIAQGVKTYATWKAGTYAEQSVGRLEWEGVAKQAGNFSWEEGKLAPGQYLGAAIGAAQIVVGLIDFHDAMEKNDTRGMIAAGHEVVQGGAAVAGALLNATMATQALVAGTIFLWWATIDGMGILGGHLAGMARNRKLRAVESLVDQAAKVANVGREMAGAWDASNAETVAADPYLDAEIRANLVKRALYHAEDVKKGIDVLHYHVTHDDPEYVGGYDDLRERVGPSAEAKMTDIKTFSNPASLSWDCNAIFVGIDRMARYALAAEGPDRGSEESKAKRDAIDADVAAENEKYGS